MVENRDVLNIYWLDAAKGYIQRLFVKGSVINLLRNLGFKEPWHW